MHANVRYSLALAWSLALSGCAGMGARPDQPSGESVASSTRHGAWLGAGVGCATGMVSGLFTGGGLNVRRCAEGAVAGAMVGGVAGYRQGVQHAKAMADAARAEGLQASVTTKTVTVQRGPDRGTSAEALDALTIDLRPDDIAQRAPATVRVLTKAAALADQSDEPVTITVRGLPAQREWIVVQLRGASRPHTNTVIVEQPASMPSVQLSPVPSPVSDDHNEGR